MNNNYLERKYKNKIINQNIKKNMNIKNNNNFLKELKLNFLDNVLKKKLYTPSICYCDECQSKYIINYRKNKSKKPIIYFTDITNYNISSCADDYFDNREFKYSFKKYLFAKWFYLIGTDESRNIYKDIIKKYCIDCNSYKLLCQCKYVYNIDEIQYLKYTIQELNNEIDLLKNEIRYLNDKAEPADYSKEWNNTQLNDKVESANYNKEWNNSQLNDKVEPADYSKEWNNSQLNDKVIWDDSKLNKNSWYITNILFNKKRSINNIENNLNGKFNNFKIINKKLRNDNIESDFIII
jgi:hypothetical protein